MPQYSNSYNDPGIDPKRWGKSTWDYFHHITFGYPNEPSIEDKNMYGNWCNVFGSTLPCGTCRDSYKLLASYSPAALNDNIFENKHSFIKWGWLMHKEVSKKLNKEYMTFDKFIHKNRHSIPRKKRFDESHNKGDKYYTDSHSNSEKYFHDPLFNQEKRYVEVYPSREKRYDEPMYRNNDNIYNDNKYIDKHRYVQSNSHRNGNIGHGGGGCTSCGK